MSVIVFIRDEETAHRNPDRPTSLLDLQGALEGDEAHSRKRVNRISSPEKWEIKQVILKTIQTSPRCGV